MRKPFFRGYRPLFVLVALLVLVTLDLVTSKTNALPTTRTPESYFYDSFDPEIDGYTAASLVRHVSLVRSDYDSLSAPKPANAVLTREDIREMVFKAISLDKKYPNNTSVLKSLIDDGKGAECRVSVMANVNAVPGFRYTTGDQTDPRIIEAVLSYLADSTLAHRISLIVGGSYQASFPAENDIFVRKNFNGSTWKAWYPDLPDSFSLQGMLDSIQSRHPDKIIEGINSNYDEILTGGRSYRDLTASERVGRTPEYYPVPTGKNGIGALYTTNTAEKGDAYNPTDAVLNCDILVNVPVIKTGPNDIQLNAIFKNYIGSVSRAVYSSSTGSYPMDRTISLNRLDHGYLINTVVNLFSYHPTNYAIIDGLVSMEGEGSHPSTRRTALIRRNLIIAGSDPVAVEAVGAATMRLNPLDIEHLRWAHAKGYGVLDLRRIVVEGMAIAAVDTDIVASIDGDGLRDFPGFAVRHYLGRTCRRWLLHGPYKAGDAKTAHIEEQSVDPREGDSVNGKGWFSVYSASQAVDLNGSFGGATDSTVVYAYTQLYSDSAKSGMLYAGGVRDMRIWINGQLVTDTILTTYNDASVYKPITLLAGDNRILVKVRKSGTTFRFSIAVTNSGLESLRDGYQIHSSSMALGAPQTMTEEMKRAFFGGRSLWGTFYHLGQSGPIAIENRQTQQTVSRLDKAQPSPFNGSVRLSFEGIEANSRANVAVYTITGVKVRDLYSGKASKGMVRCVWDGLGTKGERLPAGMYLARLISKNSVRSLRLVYTR